VKKTWRRSRPFWLGVIGAFPEKIDNFLPYGRDVSVSSFVSSWLPVEKYDVTNYVYIGILHQLLHISEGYMVPRGEAMDSLGIHLQAFHETALFINSLFPLIEWDEKILLAMVTGVLGTPRVFKMCLIAIFVCTLLEERPSIEDAQ
jgi:hypothetical protein